MRFREVERNIEREKITNNDKYDFNKRIVGEGFKKIKPETDMTIEEAKAYWDGIFDRRI